MLERCYAVLGWDGTEPPLHDLQTMPSRGNGAGEKGCLFVGDQVHGRGPTQVSSSRGGDSGPDVMPGRARVSHDVLGSGVAGILGGPRNALLGDGKMQRRRLTGDEGVKAMEAVAGGRVDGKVDAGGRQTVRRTTTMGLAVCYATVGRATC